MSTAIINLEETTPRQLSEEERNEQVRRLATWATAELAHANRLRTAASEAATSPTPRTPSQTPPRCSPH